MTIADVLLADPLQRSSSGIYLALSGPLCDVPSAGLPLSGRVVAVAPIFTVEHLDRTLKIHRLQEERSSLFILRLKGNCIVDPPIDGGDGRIVRAQPWVEPGDVGGAGIDVEVTVKTSLHRRTGL
jgi:SOS-response transcriptional repressor LexA